MLSHEFYACNKDADMCMFDTQACFIHLFLNADLNVDSNVDLNVHLNVDSNVDLNVEWKRVLARNTQTCQMSFST